MDESFLEATEIIDWKHPEVLLMAKKLASGRRTDIEIAKTCFEFVRDNIKHIRDHNIQEVSLKASEVLEYGSGPCYSKSHLLAAVLRANSIPAGICYQRLSRDDNGPPYVLHALNAVYLSDMGWYRIDARGNNENVNAQFTPPVEQLAFTVRFEGEINFPDILAVPHPVVVESLKNSENTPMEPVIVVDSASV